MIESKYESRSIRKVSRRIRLYKEEFISVSVYLNVNTDGRKFYDTVIHRKIKTGSGWDWRRGTNFKPSDIPIIIKLLKEADEFLLTVNL